MNSNVDQPDNDIASPTQSGSRLERTARATFGRYLEPDEKVLATLDAFAGETGSIVGFAATVGALIGALAWTRTSGSGLLPWLVLGGLGGVATGTAIAARRVRRANGPGSLIVKLVLTDRRLISFRRGAAARISPLRSFSLDEVEELGSSPTRFGDYRHFAIYQGSRPSLELVAWPGKAVDHMEAWYTTITQRETPASQNDATG